MANITTLDRPRTVFRCSSSIANFYSKLKAYLKLDDWHWWRNRNDQVIFFGLYHWKDYLRFLWHRGPKKVFWCGSDILAFEKTNWFWHICIQDSHNVKHYCENMVEAQLLAELLITPKICPMLFDDPDKYPISYKWSETPNVYVTCHKGREQEYGVDKIVDIAHQLPEINFHIYGLEKPELWFDLGIKEMRNLYYDLPNLIYHGQVSEAQYNQEIKDYQGFIRLNEFDGASELMTKGLLMGQYGLTYIPYPYTSQGRIGDFFEDLKVRKHPNIGGSNYWSQTLKENKEEVVDNWT